MKTKLLTLTALLIAFTLSGQTRFGVNQDVRLALQGDDKGNEAFTTNLTLRLSTALGKTDYLQTFAYGEYETADLVGGLYQRAGIGLGVSFNNWIKNFELNAMYGGGFIFREGESFANWDLTGQLVYNISPKIALTTEIQQTKRNDLNNQPFRYSGKFGIRITLIPKK